VAERSLRQAPHLIALERGVRLDGSPAGHEGQRPVEQRRRLVARARAHLVEQPLDQPPRLFPLEQRGTARSSTVDPPNPSSAKPSSASMATTPSGARPAGAELDGLGEEQLLGRQGAAAQRALETLEQHALVGNVLVDEEDLSSLAATMKFLQAGR